MFLEPISVPMADFTRHYVAAPALLKSRQRVCPPGLVRQAIVDKLGRRMTVCIRPAPPEHLADPFHTARRELERASGVLRMPSPTGHDYLAVGDMPLKTTMGEKLERLQHPLEHFGGGMHFVPLEPESVTARHTPEQAYAHAMHKRVIRGSDGEAYGIGQVSKRDARGNPTRYTLLRLPKYVFFGTTRTANDPESLHRGSGIELSAEQFAYLRQHPPKTEVAVGPSGEVFASYSRIAVPAVDADGRVIPGRPMQVRYDLKLDPSVYGGEEAFRSLRVLPFRKFTGDEAKVDRHFQRYLDKARRKFFEHVQSRPPSGPVEELLRQHNGDVEQLVASGHLGHENVLQERPGQKLRTFAARKPIGERGIVQLVMHWKAQHPTVVEGIRAHASRTYPVLDDAVIDDAIERGVGKAIHRFDASRGATFRAFARRTALGEISEAARQSGAGYGVERFAADDDVYDPRQDPDHPAGPAAHADSEAEPPGQQSQARRRFQAGNGADEPPAPRPVAPSRHAPRPSRTTERDTLHQPHGSLSEFRQVLEQALPGDEKAHAAISALHPTGDFPAGANLMEAARRTGLSLDELGKYRPAIERLKTHPAYRRYYDQHLRDVDAAREERMDRSLDRTRASAPVQHYHRALEAIRGEARVASIVARRTRGRWS